MNKSLMILLFLFSTALSADHEPGLAKLELGVGLVVLDTPDYIGSSFSQNLVAPFPYIKYRGKRLRIDDGVEARLFKTPDLLLSISGNGALPSPEENPDRAGMQKLDASVEIGPSLEYRLLHAETTAVWLEFPLRFAISIGDNIGYIGSVFNPKIAWRKPAQHKFDWKLRFAIGPLYGDENYHGYYYNVAEDEVTPQRAAFTAKQGYTGLRTDFTYSKRINKLWLGGFFRYDNINKGVIEDSPLVSVSNNWTVGIALAWVLSE